MTHPRSYSAVLLRSVLVLVVTLGLVGGTLACLGPVAAHADPSRSAFAVDGLTTNGRVNPVGIGGEAPSLGCASVTSERRGHLD
jgi:alpha-L-rhamnosidase